MKKFMTLAAVLSSTAMGASLSLDLQPTGGTTAAGFLPFEHTTNTEFSATGTNYSVFGGTVNLTVSGNNVENRPADLRAIQRNGALSDVRNDWLGIDGRDGDASNIGTFTMTVTGLPAGQYTWSSSMHDGGTGVSGGGQGNIFGDITTSFTDATGTTAGASVGSAENPAGGGGPQTESFYNTTFTSDGTTPVSLTLGTDGGPGAIFVLTNSLVITEVPEPSSALLSGVALLGLLRRRR